MVVAPYRRQDQGDEHADDQKEILTDEDEGLDQAALFRRLIALLERHLQVLAEIVQLRDLGQSMSCA